MEETRIEIGRTGYEILGPPNPPIALAGDDARPMRSDDAVWTEPLVQQTSEWHRGGWGGASDT